MAPVMWDGSQNCETHPSVWADHSKVPGDSPQCQVHPAQPYFLAMLSILSFFFIRGREVVETEASTREEVDCET